MREEQILFKKGTKKNILNFTVRKMSIGHEIEKIHLCHKETDVDEENLESARINRG